MVHEHNYTVSDHWLPNLQREAHHNRREYLGNIQRGDGNDVIMHLKKKRKKMEAGESSLGWNVSVPGLW